MLILLDSSARVAGSYAEYTIDVPDSLREVSRVSLAYADIPNPADWDLPAYVINIEGMPAGVSYGNAASGSPQVYQGLGQFVVPTEAPAEYRTFFREASFGQSLALNPPQSFSRISVRILGSNGQVAPLTADSLMIVRVE